jgi:hypothetical protein
VSYPTLRVRRFSEQCNSENHVHHKLVYLTAYVAKNRRKNQTNNDTGRQTVNHIGSQADKKTDSKRDRHTVRQLNRHTVNQIYGQTDTFFFQSLSIPVDEAKPILIKITKPCGRLAC